MAVMPRQAHQHTALASEQLFQAGPDRLLQPAIPYTPDRRLGSMATVKAGLNICGSPLKQQLRRASELAISKWRRTGLAEVSATMPIAVISRAMIDLTQTEKARTEEMRHDGYSEASK